MGKDLVEVKEEMDEESAQEKEEGDLHQQDSQQHLYESGGNEEEREMVEHKKNEVDEKVKIVYIFR